MLNWMEWVWTNYLTLLATQKLLQMEMSHLMAKGPFIQCHIPEKTLLMSYRHCRANFSLVSLQNPTTYLHETWLGELSCFDRQGNLGRQDNFSSYYKHFGLPNWDNFWQKKNGHINKVKINSAKPIGKFNKKISRHSVRVINNHAGSTLTWPTWTKFSHIKLMLCKVSSGGGQRHINGV